MIINWNKTNFFKIQDKQSINSFSIIVSVRNEERNIEKLINQLINQNYLKQLLEIIIVNDHSTDNTLQILFKYQTQIKIIDLENDIFGKKNALTKAIELSQNQYIITTDGDCDINKNWIKSYDETLQKKKINFISGAVFYQSNHGFWQSILQMEFASLVGTGAISILMQKPNMCNGANICFDKNIFKQVNGYSQNSNIASGDDMFLLEKIAKIDIEKIAFNVFQESIVTTNPPIFSQFLSQRIRWSSKWRKYTNISTIGLAFYVFLINFIELICLVLYPFNLFFVIILLFRKSLEFLLIKKVLKFGKYDIKLIYFIALAFIYPVYVSVISILTVFVKTEWKNRKI